MKLGVRMQSMSHDNPFQREMTPQPWAEQPGPTPGVYAEQEDQWAVLRHEVEVEDMQPVRSSWNQRNTEEDDIS